jgi:hypothetical protein
MGNRTALKDLIYERQGEIDKVLLLFRVLGLDTSSKAHFGYPAHAAEVGLE